MERRWPFVLASFLVAASICAMAQSDPYGGGASDGTGATGLTTRNAPPDAQSVSRRTDSGKEITFKSQTTLIQVPVVVTNKAGDHVHQLTKSDFKVLEDGKQQNIANLEEIVPARNVQPTNVQPTPAQPDGTFTNLPSRETAPRPITVIVLDEVNTPFLNQAQSRAEIIKYLANHLDSSQTTGLVAIGGNGLTVLSDLDTDPAVLIAALKKAGSEVPTMERFSKTAQAIAATGEAPSELKIGGTGRHAEPAGVINRFILKDEAIEATHSQERTLETTLQSFLSLAWSLSGVPGRKSLIWATGGFPFYLDTYTSVPGDNALRLLYERVLKALNDAQISVYPLDVRGLLADPTYSGEHTGSTFSGEAQDELRESTITSLKNFARMTGGVAYYGSNDLSGALGRAAQDSSSYYLLSYYLDRRNSKPGWRKLQVAVSRPDTEARARAGFLVTDVAVNPEVTHKTDVEFALHSLFESTGIPITQRWAQASGNGSKKKVAFALQVPANGLINEADKNRFDVEFVAQATSKGAIAGTVSQTIKGAVRPDALAQLKADVISYSNSFDLPPGEYQVRFVVRDNQSGRIGSVISPLTVK